MSAVGMTVLAAYGAVWLAALARAAGRRTPRPLWTWVRYQALAAAGAVMAFPFYWMVTTSFKPAEEAGRYPPTFWPEAARWETLGALGEQIMVNYRDAWISPPGEMTFGRYFWVSTVMGVLTTLGVLATSIPAAYAFAKMEFRGKKTAFYLVLATMMIPSQALIIPEYLILEQLGWLDRYLGLVVPFTASVFSIFLLRQFFMTVPAELWDAAQIDGAGRGAFLWRILAPQAGPALGTIALLTFLGQWNALMWPLIATTRPEMRTLMVGLEAFSQEAGSETGQLMAAATFSMLPILIAFFALQRLFIQSVARTGLKG